MKTIYIDHNTVLKPTIENKTGVAFAHRKECTYDTGTINDSQTKIVVVHCTQAISVHIYLLDTSVPQLPQLLLTAFHWNLLKCFH